MTPAIHDLKGSHPMRGRVAVTATADSVAKSCDPPVPHLAVHLQPRFQPIRHADVAGAF